MRGICIRDSSGYELGQCISSVVGIRYPVRTASLRHDIIITIRAQLKKHVRGSVPGWHCKPEHHRTCWLAESRTNGTVNIDVVSSVKRREGVAFVDQGVAE